MSVWVSYLTTYQIKCRVYGETVVGRLYANCPLKMLRVLVKLLAGSGKLCAKMMMGGLILKHNLSMMLHLMKPTLSHDPNI